MNSIVGKLWQKLNLANASKNKDWQIFNLVTRQKNHYKGMHIAR
jgi:hypothetical protein